MSDKTHEERAAEAAARKAEAEARAAEIAAEKAELERQEYDGQLARQAREAASLQAIAEAAKAATTASQTRGDELALQKQEAEAKKATAEAEKAAADAKAAQFSSFLPDFSKIEKGVTTLSGEKPVRGTMLAHAALGKAATKVAANLRLGKDDTVLITSDSDLATSDAAFLEVKTGCQQLSRAAAELLGGEGEQQDVEAFEAGAAAVAAIATALPGFLSLFSARRALSSHAVTVDSKAAIAAVAAAILAKDDNAKPTLCIDDFRLVPDGQVVGWEKELRDRRSRLATRKLEREVIKSEAAAGKAEAEKQVAALTAELALIGDDDQKRSELQRQLDSKDREIDLYRASEKRESVVIGLIDQLQVAIDSFLGALHTVPEGQDRSPFALAALREQLHPLPGGVGDDAGPSGFTGVLFLQAASGSIDQLVSDRPLAFKDKFHSIGSVTVTYWMLDTATNSIVASGVTTGSSEIKGAIGGEIRFENVP